jgi:CMP-N-acetylneuraminic acid synthetase
MTGPQGSPVRIDPLLPPLALIPARGGSKGVPGKNLRRVGGVPLIVRSVRAARAARTVGSVWVSSDDDAIGALAEQEGAGWLHRPAAIAGDTASSESALVHALGQLEGAGPLPPLFVFLQCTSPFTSGDQIDAVVTALQASEAAMALSVMPWHGFLWRRDGDGHGVGVNHDAGRPRQRRQDLEPTYLETGAIYAIRTEAFLQQQTRFVPPVLPVPIDALAPEIDTETDLALCERLAPLLDRLPSGLSQAPTGEAR